jgi:hypothetical protein
VATNITGDSKQEKQKLSIGNIASAFKNVGSNFKQKFSKTPKVTFGKGMTGTSSPFTSGTDPSKITDSLNETNRILVEIQKQLSLDFANRIAESKDQLKANKRSINDQKRTDKENKIEAKWIGNALTNTGKVLGKVDNSLGSALGLKGGLFGSIFKGLSTIVVGFLGLTAWKFFQNPDNIKRLSHFFNNIGEYTTKAIDWIKTTWKELGPKLDLLRSLPFNDIEGFTKFINEGIIQGIKNWFRQPVDATYNAGARARQDLHERGLLNAYAGYADFVFMGLTDFDNKGKGQFNLFNPFFGGQDNKWGEEPKPKEFNDGGYTGSRGGIVHPHEFVMNSDAVNKWGVNLLSSMNEGKDKSFGLGKTPRRTVISYEELPIIRQSKNRNRGNVRNNEGTAPVTSVPTYSSINPFDKDIAKGPIHYGFAEFI